MKSPILLLAVSVLVLASCTTAYKTGQTPDDVYYSAAKPQNESDDRYQKEEEKDYTYNDQYYDDRYLRMKVRNRYRWNDLDDWYSTDRYSIGYNYYFANFNNPYNRWNYYYNPYCCCLNNYNYVFVNPKAPASPPVVKRYFNLAGYTNTATNNNNTGTQKPARTTTRPVYNNTNSNSNNGLSNKIRTIFSNDNSGSGSSRTYTPSSSGSSGNSGSRSTSGSGSSGGSSGSGGVSRPTRN